MLPCSVVTESPLLRTLAVNVAHSSNTFSNSVFGVELRFYKKALPPAAPDCGFMPAFVKIVVQRGEAFVNDTQPYETLTGWFSGELGAIQLL
jgi:hypothetical protein